MNSCRRNTDWTMHAHWESMNGTVEESEHYCGKPNEGCECDDCVGPPVPIRDGGPWTHGAKVTQGSRTDISDIYRMIREHGTSELELATLDPKTHSRYYRAMDRYRDLCVPDRDFQTTVSVYWGPTGTGKSTRADFESSAHSRYWLGKSKGSGTGAWWDGYCYQATVIIDEFYGWMPRETIQRLIDRLPIRVENKGSSKKFASKNIIITSNKHPEDWWSRIGLGEAMERRFEEFGCVIYFPSREVDGVVKYPTPESYRNSEAYIRNQLT